MRINKYLAHKGIASRRKIDELISLKRVRINDKVAQLGDQVDPQKDEVFIDNQKITQEEELVYYIINKPKGVISTSEDEFGRKSVVDLVKTPFRVYPVGRLDENSTGLVLLTNDGELSHRLIHPKYHVPKTYYLTIQGDIEDAVLEKFRNGVRLKEGITAPAQARVLNNAYNRVLIEVVIHEGRYHQIRRMCAILGLQLQALKRVSIGPIELGDLTEGKSRELTSHEIELLKQSVIIADKHK